MTIHRDPDDILEAWLDETNSVRLPESTRRAIEVTTRMTGQRHGLARPLGRLTPNFLGNTNQRVARGPWRNHDMSIFAKVAIAAVAVVAVGLAWMNFGPSEPGVGGPAPTARPTATPEPTLEALPMPQRTVLAPGRYRFSGWGEPPTLTFEVPAGWTGGDFLDKNYGASDDQAGGALAPWPVVGTFVDPCNDHTLVTPLPTGIDDLADALANQPGTTGTVADVTVDGYSGKVVDITVTTDIGTCGGRDQFWVFAAADGDRRYSQVTGETNRVYILDVEGERYTYNARFTELMTPGDRAELESILDSVDILP